MSGINSLGSERVAIAAVISPASVAVGNADSNWVDLTLYTRLMAVLALGVLGAGATVDAKWQLADDATGTNTVDSGQNALVQIVKASGDNKQAVMDFDVNKSKPFTKRFARLRVSVGGSASLASAVVLGFDPRHKPATDNDLSSVVQIA